MSKMTPLRWLAATGLAAALYVTWLVSARDSEWPVSMHLHSVILWILGIATLAAVVVAAVDHRDRHDRDRHDRRHQAQVDKLSYQLGRVHGDLAQRLDVIDGRLAALVGPTQPIPAIVGAPAVYRSTVAEPAWRASDDEIRGFLAREVMDPPDDTAAPEER